MMGAHSVTGSREPDPQAVPALTGFDPSRVHICSVTDGNDYVIRVDERTYFFEWSDMFGPLFVGARGKEIDNSRIQQSALVAVSLWKRQGMQTQPQGKHLRAIWHTPATATHYYVRQGRSRVIIRSDVPPGYDTDFSEEIYVDVTASAIEARSDKTGPGLAEGESATPQGDAQT